MTEISKYEKHMLWKDIFSKDAADRQVANWKAEVDTMVKSFY